MTRYYNRLDGEARKWAGQHSYPKSERCVRVNGVRKRAKSDVDKVAGNGTFGFTMRRGKGDGDETKMVVGLDGQFKKKRGTVARHRKLVNKTWTLEQIRKAQMDELEIEEQAQKEEIRRVRKAEQDRETRRVMRGSKRNPKSRRGHRKKKNDQTRK